MAQTGVSGLVVVDGESFLDALFASAGHKAEALGSTDYKSTVDVDDRSTGGNRPAGGALEATHSRLLKDFRSWTGGQS